MTHPHDPSRNLGQHPMAAPGLAGPETHPVSAMPVSASPHHEARQYAAGPDHLSPVSAMPVSASPDHRPVSGIPVSQAPAAGEHRSAAAADTEQAPATHEQRTGSRWAARGARLGSWALGLTAAYAGVEGITNAMETNYAESAAWTIGALSLGTAAVYSSRWAKRAREAWQATHGEATPTYETPAPAPHTPAHVAPPAPAGHRTAAPAPAAGHEGQARPLGIQDVLQDPNQPHALKLRIAAEALDAHPSDPDAQDAAFRQIMAEHAAGQQAQQTGRPQHGAPAGQPRPDQQGRPQGQDPEAQPGAAPQRAEQLDEANALVQNEATIRAAIARQPDPEMRRVMNERLEAALVQARGILGAHTAQNQGGRGQQPHPQMPQRPQQPAGAPQPGAGAPAELQQQPPQPAEQMPQLPMPDLTTAQGVAAFLQQYPQYILYSRQAGLSTEQVNAYEGELSRLHAAAQRLMGGSAPQPGSRSHAAPVVARGVARRPELIGQPDHHPAAPGRRRADGTEIIPVNQGAETAYRNAQAARRQAEAEAAAEARAAQAQQAPVAPVQPRQPEAQPAPPAQRVRPLPAPAATPRPAGQGRRRSILASARQAAVDAYRQRRQSQQGRRVRTLEDLDDL